MTKATTTKRALLASVLSMALCLTMLVGSTFAWFTDTVTSGRNQILAGNLDVELYHTNGNVADEEVTGTTTLFVNKGDETFQWEPGAMLYENFTVKNVGSLALKYKLTLNAQYNTVNGVSLADVLRVAVLDKAFNGDRTAALAQDFSMTVAEFVKKGAIALSGALEAGETDASKAVIIYWQPSDKDNAYNFNNGKEGTLQINLGVTLVATQAVSESDSFGNDYDAEIPDAVSSEQALQTAIEKAQPGDTIYVSKLDLSEPIVLDKDITIKGVDGSLLNNAVIEGKGNAAVTIEDIAFAGDSYIHNQGMSALTLTGCNINVNVPKKVNNKGRAAFISLGADERISTKLDIRNNSFVVESTIDSFAAAVFGWSKIADGSVISGNTFGSKDSRYTFIAVKLMNFDDGALVDISKNTVYGTNKNYSFYAFDMYQNTSRANQYTAVFAENIIDVELFDNTNGAYIIVLESDKKDANADLRVAYNNKFNGQPVTSDLVLIDSENAGTVKFIGVDEGDIDDSELFGE